MCAHLIKGSTIQKQKQVCQDFERSVYRQSSGREALLVPFSFFHAALTMCTAHCIQLCSSLQVTSPLQKQGQVPYRSRQAWGHLGLHVQPAVKSNQPAT